MSSMGFDSGFESAMDAVLQKAVAELPGVVVLARRGNQVYHKAFGHADLEAKRPLGLECPFRMYSMTKVMTSALALALHERTGSLNPEDAVSKYIPAFDREWDVVEECPSGSEIVDVRSMITGETQQVSFRRRKASQPMLVKHLMAECSGIGYEIWGDLDGTMKQGSLETKRGYAIANALRRKINPSIYTSSCILGHHLDLAGFCNTIAAAGVLSTEPGVISYGLGATVLGRIIEIVYEQHNGVKTPLRDIFKAMLFEPLGMSSATFFDPSLAKTLPVLYGLKPGEMSSEVVRAEASVPALDPPYSNQSDHFAGPMRYDSGDTGSVMTVEDYAKFLDCLLNDGLAADGSRVLPAKVVAELLSGRPTGNSFDTGIGHMMGLSETSPFTYGWVSADPTEGTPRQCFWSGYAGTHIRLFPDDKSYIIQGIQCMDHSFTGTAEAIFRNPCLETFLKHWVPQHDANAAASKRTRVQ